MTKNTVLRKIILFASWYGMLVGRNTKPHHVDLLTIPRTNSLLTSASELRQRLIYKYYRVLAAGT